MSEASASSPASTPVPTSAPRSKRIRSQTASARYAQSKRDDEGIARKALLKKLIQRKQPLPPDIEGRGDMNPTTRYISAALRIFDDSVELPTLIPKKPDDPNSKENNANRRKHEKEVLQLVREVLPTDLLNQDFMYQSNLNDATRILIACTKNLDFLETGSWTEKATVSGSDTDEKHLEEGLDHEEINEQDKRAESILPDLLKKSAAMATPPNQIIPLKRTRSETLDSDDEAISPLTSIYEGKGKGRAVDSDDTLVNEQTSEESLPPSNKHRKSTKADALPAGSRGKTKAVQPSQTANWSAVNYNPDGKTHSLEQVQWIEQASKKLVQRVRESVSPDGTAYSEDTKDLTEDDIEHLEFTQEILVDLIDMIVVGVKRKAIRKRLEEESKSWETDIEQQRALRDI